MAAMIHAALCPCSRAGWLALVLVDRDPAGVVRFVARHAAEVGRLVRLEEPIRTPGRSRPLDMTREVTAAEAGALAAHVVDLCLGQGAARLIIERPVSTGAGGARARLVARLTREFAESAGLVVEEGRVEGGGARVLPHEVAPIVGWPLDATETERRAGLLALLGDGPRVERGGGAGGATVGFDDDEELAPPTPRQPSAPPPPRAPKAAPRTGCVDTGSAWFGVTVTEGTTLPLLYIASRTFEFGRVETDANGKKRRSFTDEDVCKIVREIVHFFRDHDVDKVNVEKAKTAQRIDDPGRAQAKAKEILRMQWAGGALWGALGLEFETPECPSAVEVRAKVAARGWRGGDEGAARRADTGCVCGGKHKKGCKLFVPMDARVAEAVRALILGWPEGTDEHQRDGGAIAIYDAMRSEAAAKTLEPAHDTRPSAPTGTRKKGAWKGQAAYARDKRAERHEKERERRKDAGCSCEGKHARECPLFAAKHVRVGSATPTA